MEKFKFVKNIANLSSICLQSFSDLHLFRYNDIETRLLHSGCLNILFSLIYFLYEKKCCDYYFVVDEFWSTILGCFVADRKLAWKLHCRTGKSRTEPMESEVTDLQNEGVFYPLMKRTCISYPTILHRKSEHPQNSRFWLLL